ncbi:MAG: nicotinate-nucleotide adenylyltransferase [Clostridium sp.]|jgi:nicotinate-nucleotide adenylyltransferase|nr:nicotinate-nucleotide adenylyltransferase [Clostridium sp.]
MKKRKKVGILGGTFNPIHIGHLVLAEWARETAGLDEVLFIPTGHPYMKYGAASQDGDSLRRAAALSMPTAADRYHMVELAVKTRSGFLGCDIETSRPGFTYTYETLDLLRQGHPDCDFYFIMGADCLFTIETWKEPERIFRACTVISAVRGRTPTAEVEQKRRYLERLFAGKILLIPFLSIEISSTDIRERVREGKSIRYLVPDPVIGFLEKRGFYRETEAADSGRGLPAAQLTAAAEESCRQSG